MMLLRGMYKMSERKRRDAGQLQLTERDLAVLTWIAQQYCISYDQLHRVLALYGEAPRKDVEKVSYSATINAVNRWLQLGLVDTSHKVLRGYSTHVWLSRKGLHQLGLPYAYYVPKASSIPHIYACNAVRFNLQHFNLNATWQAERALKLRTRRADMALEFTNEIKAVGRACSNRLAALIVRALRDANIARRLAYTLLARAYGSDFALKAYEDASEKAGRDLAKRSNGESE